MDRRSVLIDRLDDGSFLVRESHEDKLTRQSYVVKMSSKQSLAAAMKEAKAVFEDTPKPE